ncbi:MAG: ribosome biogenesis GTPase Der [Deltaproteobacteria bacterium]|nr:ribosome biogenesis GTPase Der [Deltaproteobacteria bacterium]
MIIALAGRPNVGKSSLFNRLIGKRKALVWDHAGVTRDLIKGIWDSDLLGKVEVWDLAGFGKEGISIHTVDQKLKSKIDLILLVVDGSEPLTGEDRECFSIVRKYGKPVVVAINKSDKREFKNYSSEIYREFKTETVEISAEQQSGVSEISEAIQKLLPNAVVEKIPEPKDDGEFENEEGDDENIEDEKIEKEKARRKSAKEKTIVIVGRPNAGKSSLINKISGEPVAFVSEKAGTTRDPIQTTVKREGIEWTLKDLAGVRRKSKVYGRKADPLEIFSMQFALKAMKQSDAALFIVEANKEGKLHSQDRKLLHLIRASMIPTLVLVNKWDLVRKDWKEEDFKSLLKDHLKDLSFLPVLFVSAKTGYRVEKIFQSLKEIAERMQKISTSKLNRWLQETLQAKAPRVAKHGITTDKKRTQTQFLHFSYVVQTSDNPMTFQFFCNAPQAVAEDDKRFFENKMRRTFHLSGIPLKFIFRKKTSNPDRKSRLVANPLAD